MKPDDQTAELLLLAADSGGSNTRMCLLNRAGVTIAGVRGAGVAAPAEGVLPVGEIIGGLCGQLLAGAGVSESVLSGGYFSLGGPNAGEVERALRAALPSAPIVVDREANGNWLRACAPLLGIDAVLMAGTGSVAVGLAEGGVVFAGGWGPLYDDAGSGYFLGLSALRAVLLMIDGRERRTPLVDILRRFGIEPADNVGFDAHMRIRQPLLLLTRREIADLAPDVFVLADAGEPVAVELVRRAAEDLARLAAAVAARPNTRILVLGGLFHAGEPFKSACRDALHRVLPDAQYCFRADFDLLKAACLMALTRAGMTVDEMVLHNLGVKNR